MDVPKELKFTKEHEWVSVEGDEVLIGITDFAQDKLGEIVYVELPQVDEEFSLGEAFGVIESVKSVNDVFAPVSLKIIEINDPLAESPEALNVDPYGEGWLIKAKLLDSSDQKELITSEEYLAYIREEVE